MNGFYYEEKSGLKTLKCAALAAIPGVRHGFSTRPGGVSTGDQAALSFSYNKEPERVVDENFRRFCAANGLPFNSLALTHQTHTATVKIAGAALKERGRWRGFRDVDGLVTAEPGLGLVCFTADCVPLLLADPVTGVIAAVHSGWRGTVAGIGANAVRQMEALGARPADILAAIGPSIGPCCFEVGPEVQAAFSRAFPALPVRPSHREGHTMADLWQANRLVLEQAGLAPAHIFTAEICTFCNNSLYFSHRYTNGRRGTLIAAIGRAAP